MSRVFKRGNVSPEMNMTPMIDVVFQLIIFFMLVNNIVAEQVVELIPPSLEKPKTRQVEFENQLVVNVAPADFKFSDRKENPLLHQGQAKAVQIRFQTFALDDSAGISEAIKAELRAKPDMQVILRADAAIYYEEMQLAMAAIAGAFGDLKMNKEVHLVAYMPGKGAEDSAAAAELDQGN